MNKIMVQVPVRKQDDGPCAAECAPSLLFLAMERIGLFEAVCALREGCSGLTATAQLSSVHGLLVLQWDLVRRASKQLVPSVSLHFFSCCLEWGCSGWSSHHHSVEAESHQAHTRNLICQGFHETPCYTEFYSGPHKL